MPKETATQGKDDWPVKGTRTRQLRSCPGCEELARIRHQVAPMDVPIGQSRTPMALVASIGLLALDDRLFGQTMLVCLLGRVTWVKDYDP